LIVFIIIRVQVSHVTFNCLHNQRYYDTLLATRYSYKSDALTSRQSHYSIGNSLGSVYRKTEPISDILKYRDRHWYLQYWKIPNRS